MSNGRKFAQVQQHPSGKGETGSGTHAWHIALLNVNVS